MAVSIDLKNISLDFPVFDISGLSLKKLILGNSTGRSRINNDDGKIVLVRALENVNLSLNSGDRLGLIGHNGAGKSTLLRILARIYPPTSGQIEIRGITVPLLDLSLGMDEHSTGRQNIRLRGLLLGMDNTEIKNKIEEIATFTELGNYLDLPLRTYSNGMRIRLAFAISTAVDANILLLDEVLGVGDASFQERANKRLIDLQDKAEIVVLAIHSNEVIRKSCNKGLWIDQGKVKMFGEVNDVLKAYEDSIY